MYKKGAKLVVGLIIYKGGKYLPYFFDCLSKQSVDYDLFIFDNSEDDDNEASRYFAAHFPDLELMRVGSNIGFGCAYNVMIRRAAYDNAEYFFVTNPDCILDDGALNLLVQELESDTSLGSVCPKIFKWDFADNQKTDIIDSCGIGMKPGLRFFDVGQGEKDCGQCDGISILGPSGAAALYRMSALNKVKQDDDYFDELMFMYKEDCDLAYRLFLAGYGSKCITTAHAFHDRTVSGIGDSDIQVAVNRRNKSRQSKRWSFLHQQIIFVKFWKLQSFRNKLAIIWYEIRIIGFVILFERFLLRELLELKRVWGKIKKINKYEMPRILKSPLERGGTE